MGSAEVWACQMVQLDLGTCLGPCPGYQWPRALVFGSTAFGFFPFGCPGVMRQCASVCLLLVGLVTRGFVGFVWDFGLLFLDKAGFLRLFYLIICAS